MSHVDINNNNNIETFADSNLSYVRAGKLLKTQDTVEMATKSAGWNTFKFPSHKWNMLFFSKGDHFVIGWHDRGLLVKIEQLNYQDVTERCGLTEKRIQSSMSKLVDLLEKLKSFAVKQGPDGGRYSAIFEKASGNLRIYKYSEDVECLPKKLKEDIYFKTG